MIRVFLLALVLVVVALVAGTTALADDPVVTGDPTLNGKLELEGLVLQPTTSAPHFTRFRFSAMTQTSARYEVRVTGASGETVFQLQGSARGDTALWWDGRLSKGVTTALATGWGGPWVPLGIYTITLKLTDNYNPTRTYTARWSVEVKTQPLPPKAPPPPAPPRPDPPQQWATVATIEALLKQKPFAAQQCQPPSCSIVDGVLRNYKTVPLAVASAKARGLGKPKLINGVRRYQNFDVTLCTINYPLGALRVAMRIIWHTRSVRREAWAEDWPPRGLPPLLGFTAHAKSTGNASC